MPLYWYESTHLRNFNVDWNIAFYPATQRLLQGQSPYSIVDFHNPIWALIPLIPLALAGKEIGGLLLFFLNLLTYAFMGYRLKSRPVALVAFLLSPLMFYNLFLGNIEALVLWGLMLPTPIGMFLLLIKPQIGIGPALYLGYLIWQEGGWRRLLTNLAPATIALILSFLVFPSWGINIREQVFGAYWNVSLVPWSVPIGLIALIFALRRRKMTTAFSASPFLSPYLSVGSWSIVLMGLLDNNMLMVGAVAGLWMFYILRGLIF